MGGGFGCPVIESFTMLAEATAFVIGAAAELTRLGGGGLIQPEWAGRAHGGYERQFWHWCVVVTIQ